MPTQTLSRPTATPPAALLARLATPAQPATPDLLAIVRRATVAQAASDSPDLTARQLSVLLTVEASAERLGVRELAELLDAPRGAITRAIDALAALRLAERAEHPTDGRLVIVSATAFGRAYLATWRGALNEAAAEGGL